jgi:hypothetical protein
MTLNNILRKLHEYRRAGLGGEQIKVLVNLGCRDSLNALSEEIWPSVVMEEEIIDITRDNPLKSDSVFLEIVI